MRAEALIVGAGLAGTAAAIRLARAGKEVLLLERAQAPHHKICGEFLGGMAQRHLRELGIDAGALGAAEIGRMRLARGRHLAEAPLAHPALSLSRKRLDAALIAAVRGAGVEVQEGCKVRDAVREGPGWRVESDRGMFSAPHLLLATGKQDLRALPRPATGLSGIVAFKMHYVLTPQQRQDLDNHVELMLFADGYAGLEPVEVGRANLCLVVSKARLQACGGKWESLLAHLTRENALLGQRLEGASACWEKPLAIAGVPYGFVHRDAGDAPGLYRLGDQMAVIPSFCGDGMGIALHSAHLAAQCFGDAAAYHARAHAALHPNIRRAALLSRLMARPVAQATLFGACRLAPKLLRMAARGMQLRV